MRTHGSIGRDKARPNPKRIRRHPGVPMAIAAAFLTLLTITAPGASANTTVGNSAAANVASTKGVHCGTRRDAHATPRVVCKGEPVLSGGPIHTSDGWRDHCYFAHAPSSGTYTYGVTFLTSKDLRNAPSPKPTDCRKQTPRPGPRVASGASRTFPAGQWYSGKLVVNDPAGKQYYNTPCLLKGSKFTVTVKYGAMNPNPDEPGYHFAACKNPRGGPDVATDTVASNTLTITSRDYAFGHWVFYAGLYRFDCFVVAGDHSSGSVFAGIRNYLDGTLPTSVKRSCNDPNVPKRTSLPLQAQATPVSFVAHSLVYGTITINGVPANPNTATGQNDPCIDMDTSGSGTVTWGSINWDPATDVSHANHGGPFPACQVN